MYYLGSRYYDPGMGRFVNADDAANLGVNSDYNTYNLYVYCVNNPIERSDDGGEFWNTIIGAVVGSVMTAVTRDKENESLREALFRCAVIGAASGLMLDITIATAGVGSLLICSAVAGSIGFLESLWEDKNCGRDPDYSKALAEGVSAGLMNLAFGAMERVKQKLSMEGNPPGKQGIQ